jgi:hypothetical protein
VCFICPAFISIVCARSGKIRHSSVGNEIAFSWMWDVGCDVGQDTEKIRNLIED